MLQCLIFDFQTSAAQGLAVEAGVKEKHHLVAAAAVAGNNVDLHWFGAELDALRRALQASQVRQHVKVHVILHMHKHTTPLSR